MSLRTVQWAIVSIAIGGVVACSHPSNNAPVNATNANAPDPSDEMNSPGPKSPTEKKKIEELRKHPAPAPVNPVKSFAFAPPSGDWVASGSSEGDGTFTKAAFKQNGSNVTLKIASIGIPAKGKNATALVKECETGFAQGFAKHPENTREWITKGFSLSRYADPTTGKIVVWCVSNNCKVRLDFAFGAGAKAEDSTKVADSATDAFFERNPSGGAILK